MRRGRELLVRSVLGELLGAWRATGRSVGDAAQGCQEQDEAAGLLDVVAGGGMRAAPQGHARAACGTAL